MKPLTYIKTKKASLIACALILLFFTIGLPEKVTTDHWRLYSIFDVPFGWARLIAAVLLAVIFGAIVAQGLNEYKRGK